jgi:uncharacterized protein (DUF1810 family)
MTQFDLARFTSAQEAVYNHALAEIRNGQKRSHWMWFIFPQIDGLGFSSTAKHRVLDKYYQGKRDTRTQEILTAMKAQSPSATPISPSSLIRTASRCPSMEGSGSSAT